MGRIYKPNFVPDYTEPYEIDTTTTSGTAYTRYNDSVKGQYIEKQLLASPYTKEWTCGEWTKRASMTTWASINEKYIDF